MSDGNYVRLKDCLKVCSLTRHKVSSSYPAAVSLSVCVTAGTMLNGRGWTCSALGSRKTKTCGRHSSATPLCRSACARRYTSYRTSCSGRTVNCLLMLLCPCREYRCGAMPKSVSSRCEVKATLQGFPLSVMLSTGCWEVTPQSSG